VKRIQDVRALQRTVGGRPLLWSAIDDLLIDLERTFTDDAWIPVRYLMGVKELAELLSVGRSTITGWAYAHSPGVGFPEPVHRLGGGPLWDALEVVSWWQHWQPRKGPKAGCMPNIGDLAGT
jgi:hypothetical protein